MTQEEKAKRYDESIARASKLQRTCDSAKLVGLCEYIFPELKKSEDERIKTTILNHLKKMWGNSKDDVCGVHVENAIEWFEKRGEPKSNPCEKCNHVMLNCHNFPCIEKQAFDQSKTIFDIINKEK